VIASTDSLTEIRNSLTTKMEAEEGIEPSNSGFANRCLTTWLLRRDAFSAGPIPYVPQPGLSMPGFFRRIPQLWPDKSPPGPVGSWK
jgi:hypothetical protein